MTFENIRNLREDADKTQTEIAEYLNAPLYCENHH